MSKNSIIHIEDKSSEDGGNTKIQKLYIKGKEALRTTIMYNADGDRVLVHIANNKDEITRYKTNLNGELVKV